jgi:hypothetical protein
MMFTAYMRKRIKHLNQLAGRDLTGSHEVKGSNKYDTPAILFCEQWRSSCG